MKTRIVGLVSALLICAAAVTHADPIVITSGSAMVDPNGDPLRFSMDPTTANGTLLFTETAH